MNDSEAKPSVRDFLFKEVDKKYYLSFAIGTIALVLVLVLVPVLGGNYLEVIFYPLALYFVFQQILAGFGFISGYVPTAVRIIDWLSKSAKKKSYSEEEVEKLKAKRAALEVEQKNMKNRCKEIEVECNNYSLQIKTLKEIQIINRRDRRKISRFEKKTVKLLKEKEKLEKEIEKCKEKMKKTKGAVRGKFEDKIIAKQEKLEPERFKLIMLVPLYFMLILGLVLTIIGLVLAIINLFSWEYVFTPATIRTLEGFDVFMEWYKGVMSAITITNFYIIPAIRLYKNPELDIAPSVLTGRRRRFSDFYRRRIRRDSRKLLSRQFQDLRRNYWEIRQVISKYMFIPIGLSQLVTAPIGGISVALGVKAAIEKQRFKRYEYILQIIVAGSLIALLLVAYFGFFAKLVKGQPWISIPSKILHGIFLVYAFVVFTRSPVAKVSEL